MRKRYFSLIAIALLALPVIAQDDFGGLSQGDLEALIGGGGGGRGGRGGRGGNNVQSILPDATVMYNQLKDLLKNKKVALAKEQEKPLQTLLNDEAKAVRAELEAQYPQLRNNGQNQNNNNQNRGNNNQNRGNQNNQASRIDAITLEQNAALLADIRKELTPEQVAVLDKAEKDKKCVILLDGHFSFLQNGNRGNGRGQNDREWCTFGDSTIAQRVAPIRDLMKRERKPLTEAQDAKIASLVEARLPVLETAYRDAGVLNSNNRGGQQNAQNQQQQQRTQIANNIVNQMFQAMGVQTQNQGGRGGNNNFEQIIQQACAPEATQEQKEQAIQQLSQNFGNRGGGNTPNLDQLCQNFGNRGGGRGGNNLNFNAVQTEVNRRNELILDKVIAFLKPDQASIVKKLKYEQIKSKGGAERIRGILEEEGTPATAEQLTQIQNLYNTSNQSLRTWAQEYVLKAMETTPPPQQQQQQQQQQNNQNRGNNNNNQAFQQYIAQMAQSLLPQVSKQRAQIEQATVNSVMRILTPAQVASYKINITMPPL
jgi:hypothetical protein